MINKKQVITIITIAFIGATGFLFCLQTKGNNKKSVVLKDGVTQSEEPYSNENVMDGKPHIVSSTANVTESQHQLEKSNTNSDKKQEQQDINQQSELTDHTKVTAQLIVVHICGEVKNPGVYKLASGTRLNDLIELAGGLTKKAAGDFVNQAQTVMDGQRIFIPSVEAVEQAGGFDFSLEDLSKDTETKSVTSNSANSNIVHLNTATMEELMTLPGIGETKAKSIIAYREKHGKFQAIEDIKKIEGIKDGVFNKICNLLIL